MKSGDKLIYNIDSLLIKGETYYFDHEDMWDEKYIFVRDKENMICYEEKKNFDISIQVIRKEKLDKINQYDETQLS